jgi:hypothetical protein
VNADCGRFDAWLDGGARDAEGDWARAHATGCPRCAAVLRLERLLEEPPAAEVGPAFTERVLYRVRDAERALAASRLPAPEPPGAWWLAAPAEPAAALALAAAALVLWQADRLWAWGTQLGSALGHLSALAAPAISALAPPAWRLPAGDPGQALLLGVLATVGPLAWLATWSLYRWVERLASRRAHA